MEDNEAFLLGIEDYVAGASPADNPYSEGTVNFEEWLAGYEATTDQDD